MTDRTSWTVVSHAADDSAPAIAAAHLMSWLHDEPSVDLHTVLWAAGPTGTAPFDFGTFADVGAAHVSLLPRALRAVGLSRLGGGLAGRRVRASLRKVPTDGVLYLSSAHAAAVTRYLPPGDRTIVTHLHTIDREADPPFDDDRVARLVQATDVWLAVDEKTRQWAAEEWGLDADQITLVPEPVDPRSWNRATRPNVPDELRLGVSGGVWFGTDHCPRLVQTLLRMRPGLKLELAWTNLVADRAYLAPLLHDLDKLGVAEALELPESNEEVQRLLDDIDILALTVPDNDHLWAVWEAAARGVPIVCFDSHQASPSIQMDVGLVVSYPDIVAMAEAILEIHDEDCDTSPNPINPRRAALRRRDVTVIGKQLIELTRKGSPS